MCEFYLEINVLSCQRLSVTTVDMLPRHRGHVAFCDVFTCLVMQAMHHPVWPHGTRTASVRLASVVMSSQQIEHVGAACTGDGTAVGLSMTDAAFFVVKKNEASKK